MSRYCDIKVFNVKIKYEDGSEIVYQYDVKQYRKVMSIFVTPVVTSNGLIMDGKSVKSVELYKPSLEETEYCPVKDRKCIRPDGDCSQCFLANEFLNKFDT